LKTISPPRHEAHEDFLNKKFASNGSADFDTFGADASLPLFFCRMLQIQSNPISLRNQTTALLYITRESKHPKYLRALCVSVVNLFSDVSSSSVPPGSPL
jgi:hypothetical protein